MNLLDLIILLLYGFLCYRFGWLAREASAKSQVNKLIRKIETENSQEDIVRIYFEQEQGTLFAFNYETNEFIAQGKDRESLLSAMVERFPRTKFIVEREKLENLS